MYGRGAGLALGTTLTAGSVAALPSTGGHTWLEGLMIVTLGIGLVITVAVSSRIFAARFFN